jgi:5'-nucleotidase/UDP-sugar diphosphatase
MFPGVSASRAVLVGVVSFFAVLAVASPRALARPLQIIHTNDLHSHLDHALDPARGSYAAVKATIDRLKWEARSQGIDTLVLDAGDFSEDSQYYLPDEGLHAWKAMNAMGYDAVALGNHDWLMGPTYLDLVVGRAKPNFTLLGANFLIGWEHTHLVKYMRQWLEVKRAGARIAIYGLTTDELFYGWAAKPISIYKPAWSASEDLPRLRSRNDYVIALTHMGVTADRNLVTSVPGLDLVVGGHSHTALAEPILQKDPRGKIVPIVQAGMHGNYVGDLLVDVEPGKPLQILRYQLVSVYSDGPRDAAMDQVMKTARERLDETYGREWLREVVGHAEVPLQNAYYLGKATVWSAFASEAIRQGGKAEVAIDITEFHGFDQPAGPITREQLFLLYPRILEFDNPYGYTIWTATVKGWLMKLAIGEALSMGLPLSPAGIEVILDELGRPMDYRIGGRPIPRMQDYKVALPEALARGALATSKYMKLAFRGARDTRLSIWKANEQHLKRIGGVIKAPVVPPAPLPTPSPTAPPRGD